MAGNPEWIWKFENFLDEAGPLGGLASLGATILVIDRHHFPCRRRKDGCIRQESLGEQPHRRH